jgi:murein DD-endopeptidase MepM/ murein hydrolase activator NlpD
MKHRKKWTILFINSSSRRPKYFKAAWGVMTSLLIIVLVSLLTIARMSFIVVTTIYHKIDLRNVQKEHSRLNQKITFLEKQVQICQEKFNKMGDYEKNLRRTYGIKQIPDDIRLAGVGGAPSTEEQLSSLYNPSLQRVFRLEENISAILRQINLQDTLLCETAEYVTMQQKRWKQIPTIRPTKGRIASRFGWRTDPMGGEGTCFHEGLDISNAIWTSVYATGDGIVQFVGVKGTLGKAVCIAHYETGFETIYAHLEKYVVKERQKIHRGELIGFMGNTGKSTGPHLHYEVRKLGKALNPEEFILPDSVIVD